MDRKSLHLPLISLLVEDTALTFFPPYMYDHTVPVERRHRITPFCRPPLYGRMKCATHVLLGGSLRKSYI